MIKTGLATESVEETFSEAGASNAWVKSGEGIVQDVGMDSTGQGKTGLLATGQVGTTFDDFASDTIGQTLKVSDDKRGANCTLRR